MTLRIHWTCEIHKQVLVTVFKSYLKTFFSYSALLPSKCAPIRTVTIDAQFNTFSSVRYLSATPRAMYFQTTVDVGLTQILIMCQGTDWTVKYIDWVKVIKIK